MSGIQIWDTRVKGFPETKCFTAGPNLDRQRAFIFPLDHRGFEIWNVIFPSPRPANAPFYNKLAALHFKASMVQLKEIRPFPRPTNAPF
jgi:hypothetical protein